MILNPSSSWSDVERAANNDPVLAAMLEWVHRGIPREEALIAAIVFLSKEREKYFAEETERLRNAPPARTMEIGGQTYELLSASIPLGRAEVPKNPHAAWYTRGQADKVAIADALRTLMGAEAARPYLSHLERAIDALDKP
jgi:hypothetical protein